MAINHMLDYFSTLYGINPRKFCRGATERIIRSIPYRMLVLWYFFRAYFSRDFREAVFTVRMIARDPLSRHLDTWGEINRLTVSNPKQGENMYRHFAARLLLDRPSPMSGVLVELAYLAYRRKRR